MAISPTQAIGDLWDAHAEVSGQFAGGALYAGEAPDTVSALPYAVLMEVSGPVELYSTGFAVARNTYQISCMAGTLAQAEALAKSVRDLYHKATLTIAGGNVGHCLAGETRWTLGVGLGLGGSDCWVCYVELEILWSR